MMSLSGKTATKLQEYKPVFLNQPFMKYIILSVIHGDVF